MAVRTYNLTVEHNSFFFWQILYSKIAESMPCFQSSIDYLAIPDLTLSQRLCKTLSPVTFSSSRSTKFRHTMSSSVVIVLAETLPSHSCDIFKSSATILAFHHLGVLLSSHPGSRPSIWTGSITGIGILTIYRPHFYAGDPMLMRAIYQILYRIRTFPHWASPSRARYRYS